MPESLDLLLIVPPGGHYAERWSGPVSMPPLGLAYLAGTARKAGCSVRIVDGRAQKVSNKELARLITDTKPRIIGVTAVTETRFAAAETARAAREAAPDAFIVLGGPHPSAADKDTLKHLPEADAVVRGEGERPLLKLIDAVLGKTSANLESVPSLTWRKRSLGDSNETVEIVVNPATTYDGRIMDEIPSPAWDLLPWEAYNFTLDVPGRGTLKAANMMTSRGCPWNCPFCMTPALSGTRIRVTSESRVIQEMRELRDHFGTQAIWFFDDTFSFQRKRVKDFCREVQEHRVKMPWFCEIRVDSVDRALLELMRDAGCYKVGFGIESGNDEILEKTEKGITVQQAENVVRWCDELGIQSHAFFILGHPGETLPQALKTIEFIERLPESCEPSLSLMRVYPGTGIEKRALEEGVLPKDFSWSTEALSHDLGLSAAQGNVPLYRGRLSWPDIGHLLARWSKARKQPPWKRAMRVLKSIRTMQDVRKVYSLAKGYYALPDGAKTEVGGGSC